MTFFACLLLFVGGFMCYGVYDDRKKSKSNPDTKVSNTTNKITLLLIGIALIIAAVVILISSGSSSSGKNKWQSLTKEEKAWYERNYGNGKSEKYTKAIEDYKKTH